jgi:hypothetical protein
MVATVVGMLAAAPREPVAGIATLLVFGGLLGALAWSVSRADHVAASSEEQGRWASFEAAFRAHVERLDYSAHDDGH